MNQIGLRERVNLFVPIFDKEAKRSRRNGDPVVEGRLESRGENFFFAVWFLATANQEGRQFLEADRPRFSPLTEKEEMLATILVATSADNTGLKAEIDRIRTARQDSVLIYRLRLK